MNGQGTLFASAEVQKVTGRCPECGKPVTGPALGPVQRAMLPEAVELHARCLTARLERERGTQC